MKTLTFKPFVGENYRSEKLKILILGESHYGNKNEEKSDFTINTVKNLGQRIYGKGHRYFTTIAKIQTGKLYTYLNDQEAYQFWNRVAFYNYVQGFVGNTARVRPTKVMFEKSKGDFEAVLHELQPDIVVVTGKSLERELKMLDVDFGNARPCYWYHPVSPKYFKKGESLRAYEVCCVCIKKRRLSYCTR